MLLKSRYKVTLNWYGELHTFYTNSGSTSKAKANAISRLAKKLGKSRYIVRQYYNSGKDNFKVERRS